MEDVKDAAPSLRRDISFSGSAFLAFNGAVGAGIFAMPGTLMAQFGMFSPWLFPLFGGLVLLIALPLAQLAARTSVSGGPVAYAAVFGRFIAFEVGWLYYIARVTALAANCNVFATYAAAFWPELSGGLPRAALIIGLIALPTMLNIVGVRRVMRAIGALALLKAVPLVVVSVAGLVMVGSTITIPTALPPLSEIEVAALLVLYAFVGFENCLVPADETADARRTIPRAMVTTTIAIVVLFFLVQLAYVAVMQDQTTDSTPLIAMAASLGGPLAGALLTLTALFSIAGNLTGNTMATPRITYALAQQGSLPAWFGRVSKSFAVPANSILFLGIVGASLAISGSFAYLAVVSTLARLVVYIASLASLPRLRKAEGETAHGGIGNGLMLASGLAVCVWAMLQSGWAEWQLLLALVAAGSGLEFIARRAAR